MDYHTVLALADGREARDGSGEAVRSLPRSVNMLSASGWVCSLWCLKNLWEVGVCIMYWSLGEILKKFHDNICLDSKETLAHLFYNDIHIHSFRVVAAPQLQLHICHISAVVVMPLRHDVQLLQKIPQKSQCGSASSSSTSPLPSATFWWQSLATGHFSNTIEDNILISLQKPRWLIAMANMFVVIHVIGSYPCAAPINGATAGMGLPAATILIAVITLSGVFGIAFRFFLIGR
ncbi:Lysine histidine transporter 1 [Platanthera guangdongensis]|uniref:Lysine histidine transporter 1 n=1 Tax=Platanthera guangdongensis TaxID=2320717 RepID=A0ABR2N374_9ASPA